ncbi:MAG: hypothetical protein H0W65_02815 [Sphingomonas sp.]|uniref:hypothetical protein n=1 Tax=Sphingomonas sp. TaxID=28214 RepID=UPI00181377FE|nr:hypothetical protein [Sphingomonas sp.]MBA3666640.1 hypothetical protein [Sphingomonas sp.]
MTIICRTAAILFCGILAASAQAETRTALAIPAAQDIPTRPAPIRAPQPRDGSHDFDFEFGTWKAHVARRLRPLTGSSEWVQFDGISTVAKVWNGAANFGELRVTGPTGEIQGLSLRLYDPASREWKISWANSRDGALTPPMVGVFDGKGGGEFYNADTFGGRQILARFIFSGTTGATFRIEQSFSADAGRTWEVNWIADFNR